jgi:endoglucanase
MFDITADFGNNHFLYMKHPELSILRLVLLVCLNASGITYSATPVEINGRLKVKDNLICNRYGNQVQLRGMSSHGIQWFGNCITEKSLDWLAYGMNADIFRVAVYMQENGWITDTAKFTRLADSIIEMTGRRGMYSLIDCHVLTPGDPMYNIANATRFFDHMAYAHKDKDWVIYELCNEPNGDTATWERVKEYADSIIKVIRRHDPDNLILVGSPGWSTLGGEKWTEIRDNPVKDANTAYSFHFYAGAHKDEYRELFREAAESIPLFITECGMMNHEMEFEQESSDEWFSLISELKISWVNWSFSDLHVQTSAIFTPGTCSTGVYCYDSLSQAGKYIYDKMSTPDEFDTLSAGYKNVSRPYAKLPQRWKYVTGNGVLKIRFNSQIPTAVRIFDLSGKTVMTFKPEKPGIFKADMSRCAPGVKVVFLEGYGGL